MELRDLFTALPMAIGYRYQLNLETNGIKMIAQTGGGYADGIIRNLAVDLSGNAHVPIRGRSTGDIRIQKYDTAADTWTYTGKSDADAFPPMPVDPLTPGKFFRLRN